MSETPKKILKKRGRKPKEASVDDNCRFCDCNLTAHTAGSKTSFENLFKPSRRQESQDLILAEGCESISFKLQRSETLSEGVCRPCGRKIRNAAELYNFVKELVSLTLAKGENTVAASADDSHEDSHRIKRQLPSTVTKKFHQEENEKESEGANTCQKSSRKSLFSEKSKELPEGPESIGIKTPHLDKDDTTSTNQNNDFLNHFCNIDTIYGKESTQLKVVILQTNGNVAVRESFDDLTNCIIKNLALKKWKPAANGAFRHPELKQYITEATERAVSKEFDSLSKSETLLKGRKVEEVIAFSNKLLVHETSVLCPLWYACLKGACGKKQTKSPRKGIMSTNAMALATASLARIRHAALSAFGYRISTIIFHSGTKYDDIIRLNRLGLCMSLDSTIHFQRQLGENFNSKILMWKKTTEENLTALNMLKTIKSKQVPVLTKDDMEITTTINFEETTIKAYPNIEPTAFNYCNTLLDIVKKRRDQSTIDSDILDEAIDELQNLNLPTFK